MKVDFTFKHVESSEAVSDHALDRISKLGRFELKPMDVHFTFEMEKQECSVHVIVLEGRRKFQAECSSGDFYKGIDNVVNKLLRQMSKDKRRVKSHKNAEQSHYGKLARLTPELDPDYSRAPLKKVG